MEIQNKDICIHNGMCTFSLGCKLNLKEIQAWSGTDVISCTETSRGLIMKFRDWPSNDTCTIYSSGKAIIRCKDSNHRAQKEVRDCARGLKKDGVKVITKSRSAGLRSATAQIGRAGKITIAGNDSERHAKETARHFAQIIKEKYCNARLSEYKFKNICGRYDMPFGIHIWPFVKSHRPSYCEARSTVKINSKVTPSFGQSHNIDTPSPSPAMTIHSDSDPACRRYCRAIYHLPGHEGSITIRHSGSITVSVKSEANIIKAIKHIYPLVEAHQKPLPRDIIQRRLARNSRRDAVIEDEGAEDDDTGDEDGDSDDSSSDLSLFEYIF